MEITIKTNDKKLQIQLRMARVKAGFIELGYSKFPRHILQDYYRPELGEPFAFINECQQAWSLRTHNEAIVEFFEQTLEAVKNE